MSSLGSVAGLTGAGGPVASATLGGIGSVLGGGKFGNGAITGAFGYLFNNCGHQGPCNAGDRNEIAERGYNCSTPRCMLQAQADVKEAGLTPPKPVSPDVVKVVMIGGPAAGLGLAALSEGFLAAAATIPEDAFLVRLGVDFFRRPMTYFKELARIFAGEEGASYTPPPDPRPPGITRGLNDPPFKP